MTTFRNGPACSPTLRRRTLATGLALAVLSSLTPPAVDTADAAPPPRERSAYGVSAMAELGFLAVASHVIQLGNDGTEVDYTDDGGQDVLFPFTRMSIDVRLASRHHLVLLYQPLSLESETVLRRDLRIDGLDYPAGTPTAFRYDFPFWRLSYFYDFFGCDPKHSVAIGGGLQIRNATISFKSLDGTLLRSNRNIGPVPLLSFRGHYDFDNGVFLGGEVEGFYAPISVLNGSDTEVTGAIVDASVRVGWKLPWKLDLYLNLRYLGGGAVGTGDPNESYSDGYTKNWLHFVTTSLGVAVHIL